VKAIQASDVSARIEALVARYDGGDWNAAARRLGTKRTVSPGS
jgi:hypothetical protein